MIRTQGGSSKLFTLFTLALLGCAVYVGGKFLPVYLDHYQFQSEVSKIAHASGRQTLDKSVDNIRREVAAMAQELGIILDPEDVEVRKSGHKVDISLQYKRVVELPRYPVELRFEVEGGDKVIRKLNKEIKE